MNRIVAFLLTIAASLLLTSTATAADLKIGYVNAALLLDRSPQAELVADQLKQEFAPRSNKLMAEQKEVKEAEEKLAREADFMSAADRERQERELLGRKRDLRRAQDDFRDDLNARRNEEISKLLATVQKTIEALGKESDFDLIVYEGIAYANPRIDLTDKVLERLKSTSQSPANAGAKK